MATCMLSLSPIATGQNELRIIRKKTKSQKTQIYTTLLQNQIQMHNNCRGAGLRNSMVWPQIKVPYILELGQYRYQFIYLVIYLVQLHWQIIQPVRPIGLSRLVHEKPIRLSLICTNLDLNALMLGASTVRWTSKFHPLINLIHGFHGRVFKICQIPRKIHGNFTGPTAVISKCLVNTN